MSNPHEAKLYDTLASSYHTEVGPVDGGWVATVYIVTKTSRLRIFQCLRLDELAARNAAYEFIGDRPR